MLTRTRTCKESLRNNKPTPKPTAKPAPKPMAKKNGRNGSVEKQITKSIVTKVQTRTPSPTTNGAPSRNNNGRTSKKISMDSLDLADGKCSFHMHPQNRDIISEKNILILFSILFYSILFYSILFYSILFCSILFYLYSLFIVIFIFISSKYFCDEIHGDIQLIIGRY